MCTHILPDRTLKAWKNAWFFSQSCSKNLEFFTLAEKLTKIYLSKKIRNKLFEILSKSDDYLEITEIIHQFKLN